MQPESREVKLAGLKPGLKLKLKLKQIRMEIQKLLHLFKLAPLVLLQPHQLSPRYKALQHLDYLLYRLLSYQLFTKPILINPRMEDLLVLVPHLLKSTIVKLIRRRRKEKVELECRRKKKEMMIESTVSVKKFMIRSGQW